MACEEFQEDISALVDGELTGVEHARLTAHLRTCRECNELLGQFQYTSSLARQLDTPRAPAFITDAAMRLVRAMPRQAREPWSLRVRHILFEPFMPKVGIAAVGLAAVVVLAVVVGRDVLVNRTGDSGAVQATASSLPTQVAEEKPSPSAVTAPSSGPGAAGPAAPTGDVYHLAQAPGNAGAMGPAAPDYRDATNHGRRDVSTFNEKERVAWQMGTWHHEKRFGRDGWWWVVDGAWYWYEQSTDGAPAYVSEVRFVNPLPVNRPDPQ
jgi:anti-sigma factor RsiW